MSADIQKIIASVLIQAGYIGGMRSEDIPDNGIRAADLVCAAIAADPDVQELLRWLDFKSCGWHPDEETYRGAHKLMSAFKPDYKPSR